MTPTVSGTLGGMLKHLHVARSAGENTIHTLTHTCLQDGYRDWMRMRRTPYMQHLPPVVGSLTPSGGRAGRAAPLRLPWSSLWR